MSPNRHKTPLLGWHPRSTEDAAWIRYEAERKDVPLGHLLDEALTVYRALAESAAEGPGWALRLEKKPTQGAES